MRQPRPLRAAIAVAAVAIAVLAGCSAGDGVANQGDTGYISGNGNVEEFPASERQEAPSFEGTLASGEEWSSDDHADEVMVVNFWYAACPPCRAEAPDLAEISQEYTGDVQLLGINGTDDAATADAFAQTYGITYPSLDDGDASAVAALEGLVPLRAMPTTVVLDREGRPAARIVGLASKITLSGLIDDVLAEG